MSTRVYRIGEAAKLIGVKTSALRFWEEEFSQIRPKRTDKGQRYYSEKDMQILRRIHELLHVEGMTISGVQKALKRSHVNIVAPEESYAMHETHGTQRAFGAGVQLLVEQRGGDQPTFFPDYPHADTMPTPKDLSSQYKSSQYNGAFPDCEKCDENAYLSAQNAQLEAELALAQEKIVSLENTIHALENSIGMAKNEQLIENTHFKEKHAHTLLEIRNDLEDLLRVLT